MRYTNSHEWIKLNDSLATIGVSRFAQKELGEIVHVELPKVGAFVQKGKELAVLESSKAAADVYSPVSGKVTQINNQLLDSPGLVNESAEDLGWLVKVEVESTSDVDDLMDSGAYNSFVGA